jgi:hypothetical protein
MVARTVWGGDVLGITATPLDLDDMCNDDVALANKSSGTSLSSSNLITAVQPPLPARDR